jgi:serine/threonine protein kinase/Flp pilus assembly protein TadD
MDDTAGTLGDFRLLRELGRGGMGVVYEAEQLSLGRRVALKVLPFAGVLDPRQLQRFLNEARAAACLHHPGIVPVHAVGQERGVHFYAMQLIEGCTLASVIHELAGPEDQHAATGDDDPRTAPYSPPRPAPGSASTAEAQATPTPWSERGRDHYRRVAQLGVQAAEALEYAHQMGVLHRDIKPANLLLDARGNLWITDFGLAQVRHGDAALTMTGDLVGTLRYMSPEQARGQRVGIDHRTDVYSVGVTLYELLTLRPAFRERDRAELLRKVECEDPPRPRRLDPGIPVELETIVLKAMEKNPNDRYATAQEMADDLLRWLGDRPIKSRRPSWRQVAVKWARRHRPAVWATAVVLLVAALLAGATGLLWFQKRVGAEAEARALLKEAQRLGKEEKWPEALSAARHANGALAGIWADADLRRQVEELARDMEMAQRLQEARLRQSEQSNWHPDYQAASAAYQEAFAWYGLNLDGLDAQQAGERMRSRSIGMHLAAAVDDWAYLRRELGRNDWHSLLVVSRTADPNPWRDRLRDALEGKDPKVLEELASSDPGDDLPPATAVLLSRITRKTATAERAVQLLRQVQRRHPDDFWVNHQLAYCLWELQPPRHQDAVRYYTVAVALQPHSPGAHFNLGVALSSNGQRDEAMAEFRETVRLKEDSAEAHFNLGIALCASGQDIEAIAEYQKAIRFNKDHVRAHINLGATLANNGRVNEAIPMYQQFLLTSDNAEVRTNLGAALMETGEITQAITEIRRAIFLDKHSANAHYNLGHALMAKRDWDKAIVEFRDAIALNQDDAEAHIHLGRALRAKGLFGQAVEALCRGHQLGSSTVGWRVPSADWLRQAEEMALLDDRLSVVLEGKDQPKDAAERLIFAQLCQQFRQQYAAAARFYAEAFAERSALSTNLQTGHRYNAACAAALAGCGEGKDAIDLDEKERGRLRRQALDWLRADLEGWGRLLNKEPKRSSLLVKTMRHWLDDQDFAGVRKPQALAKLPADERQAWQKLWADVAGSLARAGASSAPEKNPDGK